MEKSKSYNDLEIFQLAKKLAVEVHAVSLSLPKFEMYEQGSRVRRSSKAVPSAIVEGYGRRRYKAEFVRYLIFAIAECDETLLHLDLLFETNSLQDEGKYIDLRKQYDELSKRINRFISWVEENHK